MKEQLTSFKCDNCNEESDVFKPGLDGKIEFPYKAGWVYIYNFNYQRAINTSVDRQERKDKHFCKEKCALEYISKIIILPIKSKNVMVKRKKEVIK